MPLRDLWGFDHLAVDSVGYGLCNFVSPLIDATGVNASWVNTAGSSFGNRTPMIIQDSPSGKNWCGASVYNRFAFNHQGIFGDYTKRLAIGFRIRFTSTAINIGTFGANTTAATGLYPSGGLTAATVGLAAGEYFIEHIVDVAALKQYIYADGVLIYTNTLTAAQMTAISSGTGKYFVIGGLTYTTNTVARAAVWQIADLYFADQTTNDPTLNPRGPMMNVPILINGVSGSDWAYSSSASSLVTGSTGLENTIVPSSTYIYPLGMEAPFVENISGTSASVLTASLSFAMDPGAIIATKFLVSAKDQAAARTISVGLTSGGSNSAKTVLPLTGVYQYGITTGVFLTAIDGSAWTMAKVQATQLITSITA